MCQCRNFPKVQNDGGNSRWLRSLAQPPEVLGIGAVKRVQGLSVSAASPTVGHVATRSVGFRVEVLNPAFKTR